MHSLILPQTQIHQKELKWFSTSKYRASYTIVTTIKKIDTKPTRGPEIKKDSTMTKSAARLAPSENPEKESTSENEQLRNNIPEEIIDQEYERYINTD